MANTRDTLLSQLPGHVKNSYPRYVQFLEAYYEWLSLPDNPYARIKHHMDFLTFEKSMDDYTAFLQEEYLHGIPKDVLSNKQQLIEWSRDFHLSRGSHDSLKFIFNVMFGEDTTEVYLPKDNILKPSDGVWIEDQSVMIVTNPGNPEDLQYKQISQRRHLYDDIYEEAYATVETYRINYTNGFNVVELTLVEVNGTFKQGYPVVSGEIEVWPVPTVVDFTIDERGENYFVPERINFRVYNESYETELVIRRAGQVDTRLTTMLPKDQVELEINGNVIDSSEYEYDGQTIVSPLLTLGSDVVFRTYNVHPGIMYVSQVDEQGGITELSIMDYPIGVQGTSISLSYDLEREDFLAEGYFAPDEEYVSYVTNIKERGFKSHYINVYQSAGYAEGYTAEKGYPVIRSIGLGSGFVAFGNVGVVRHVPGFYRDTRGHLSSNMYLQDSDFYQAYSYVIKTEQDITKYSELVKDLLHPAGHKMFGNVRVLSMIESEIGIVFDDTGHFKPAVPDYSINRYSFGDNFSWYAKQGALSKRVYSGDEFTREQLEGTEGYALQDKSLERTYDQNGDPLDIDQNGWMTSSQFVDWDIRQPQDYTEEEVFRGLYMESSYLLTLDVDEKAFVNKYIKRYDAYEYVDEDYTGFGVLPQQYVEQSYYDSYFETAYVLTGDIEVLPFLDKYIDVYTTTKYTEEGYAS